MNEYLNCTQAMADAMRNNATNGYDFAIALVVCFTLLVIAVIIICKWFAWKKYECKEAADAAERQQAAEKAYSEQKARTELLNKLLNAIEAGPQCLKKEDYQPNDLYYLSKCKYNDDYIAELRKLIEK